MKRNNFSKKLPLILFCAVILSSCTEDAWVDGGEKKTLLTVQFTDATYQTMDTKETSPRTSDDSNYTTTFTVGDQIGIFATKNGMIIPTCNNICIKYGWGGNTIYNEGPGVTYYTYYPYQENLKGELNPTATDAAGFFANVISQWTPTIDQSTQEKYGSFDLMIARGEIGDKADNGSSPLHFLLKHQMGLIVIDGSNLESNPELKFNDITPYKIHGAYRYLVKPNTKIEVSGNYRKDSKTWKFSFGATVSASKYKKYTVR